MRLSHALVTVTVAMALVLPSGAAHAGGPANTPAAAEPAPPKIAAAVRDSVADGRTGTFWVRLAKRADLGTVAGEKTRAARATEVIRVRKEAADSSQRRVIATLRDARAGFTSFWISNTVRVTGDGALLERLAALPEVEKIEADVPVRLPKPAVAPRAQATVAGVEWNVGKIRADQVWDEYSDRGQGIVVANIDTGVQWDHPALLGQYRGNTGGGVNHDYAWFNPAGGCPTAAPCDTDGHGTHTMGTMAGDDGGTNRIGVAPGVRWIAAKGCEGTDCSAADLLAAGQWMLAPTDLAGQNPRPDLAPDVVNNSWGGLGYSEWYADVLASWVQAGIFPAFSIGNDGPDCGTASYPGGLPHAYSSAAFDVNDVIAPFSSRGDGAPYIKPDIAAPGVNVRSSVPGGYAGYSGTSMASPHTAATVALIWAAVPSLRGNVDATREILDSSAVPKPDTSCASAGTVNEVWGHGKLDAYAAVTRARSGVIAPGTELPLVMGYNRSLPGTDGHWGFSSVDRDPATYWEVPAFVNSVSINYAFDGGRRTTDRVVVQLPAGEPARTLTMSVQAAYEGTVDNVTVSPAQTYSFNPATGNKVTITFPPVHGCCLSLSFPSGPWSPTIKIAEVQAFSAAGKNAALGRPVQGSAQPGYGTANTVDGNTSTYWESTNNAFPQSLTVDLGATCRIYQVEMALPPSWGARTQTLSIEGSTDGVTYRPIAGSRAYAFNPASGNTVATSFNMAAVRYVRLVFIANTAWPAGQLSELRVLAS
ncbi:S8 family serine peptidase [Streptosporangium sp. NPDC048865]|uniref:S8 family serine peptidase n=1 Tax=Streptosporangium sp. NPDC048865 TaxID=3155766 RepID=UPI003423A3FC